MGNTGTQEQVCQMHYYWHKFNVNLGATLPAYAKIVDTSGKKGSQQE